MDTKSLAIENANIFKNNLIGLLNHADFLIQSVNSHPDVIKGKVNGTRLSRNLLSLAIAAADASAAYNESNGKGLCHGFIERSQTRWLDIGKQDINYLINNSNDIFGIDERVPKDQIDAFSESFTLKDSNGEMLVSKTNLSLLWTMINGLIIPSIRFVHYMREPYVNEDGKNAYKNKEMYQDIDIRTVVKEFKVTGLKFK